MKVISKSVVRTFSCAETGDGMRSRQMRLLFVTEDQRKICEKLSYPLKALRGNPRFSSPPPNARDGEGANFELKNETFYNPPSNDIRIIPVGRLRQTGVEEELSSGRYSIGGGGGATQTAFVMHIFL